jgi:hypothetical protein
MIAAEIPFPDVISALLCHPSIDINARARSDGRTALATAVAHGNAEAAQLLLQHGGADPFVVDAGGRSVFDLMEGGTAVDAEADAACAFLLGEWARGYALAKAGVLVEGGRASVVAMEEGGKEEDAKRIELFIPCSEEEGAAAPKRVKWRGCGDDDDDHHQHKDSVGSSVAAAVVSGAVHSLCEDTFRELLALMGRTAAGPEVLLRFPPVVEGVGEGRGGGEEGAGGMEGLVVLVSDDDEEEEEGEGEGVVVGA